MHEKKTAWLRPDGSERAEPRWGHPLGLQVGIPPIPGPRGLLRVFAPYLDHPRERLTNFIAVEPIPEGGTARGYSELEPSTLDPGRSGKRLWSADRRGSQGASAPVRGTIFELDGIEHLEVWIGVERFDNGADVEVRMRFRSDRPHEVELAGFARPESAPLDALILTATMGNWARLRRLELADRVVAPAELWPGFSDTGFTEHARFPLGMLRREGRSAVVGATGDELAPETATYADDTAEHWRFLGRRARQSWIVDDPHPELEVLVNARWSYWASASEIPGGPAFENFEITEPFVQGATRRFRIDPLP